MCCQVAYLQRNGATGKTRISIIKKDNKWHQIRGDEITSAIRAMVRAAGLSIGFTESEISARSLRAGGAMALLVAQVDPDTIRLAGRWRNDMMLR